MTSDATREMDAPPTLLAPDEPAPVEEVNPEGRAPLLLVCDHATRFIPRALDSLGLDEALLSRHIAWDIGIADVTRHLARRLDAPAVISHFSRLIIDPNRKLDAPSSIPEVSDGVPVPGNRGLTPEGAAARVATFFEPYHDAIDARIERLLRRGTAPVLISMHSFTPVMESVERPWKIGVLWNKDPRLPVPLIRRLAALGIPVGDNQPYSGRDDHGYTQHRHGDARGLANALIEVRQDLIDTHHGAEAWSAQLAEVLDELLKDPALFEVQKWS
jgi:predicted N-formylglutamate amidohydrolase